MYKYFIKVARNKNNMFNFVYWNTRIGFDAYETL